MDKLVWDNRYNIGVDSIDKDHKKLFSIMGKLVTLIEDEENNEWVCQEGIKYLKNHTLGHYEREEAYMRSINYADYDIHKRLHDNFRNNTLPALERELEATDYSMDSVRHFLGVCVGWTVAHTKTEDQAMAIRKGSKWVGVSHEDEMRFFEQAVTQTIYEMFTMRAEIVSEHYGGENFGKLMCLNFIYHGKKGEEWNVLLVFEERLILTMVGNMMNAQYLKIDDMVLNIFRYTSRQLLDRIRERIPFVDMYKLKRESLLTYEQLLNSFERQLPSCSLLIDTGNGYMAFCVSTSDSIQGKITMDISAENAMDKINTYIDKGNKNRKRILVVDDSDLFRKRMIMLLEPDYAVMEAASSISAIRHIAINKPDLILLDYEMPVCDGKQMLAMLRSDPDIADIPVIFLTGRGDKESVNMVKSLKPEGYLLKVMTDEEIKKSIDIFFDSRRKKKNS